jgi:hypothetical protein
VWSRVPVAEEVVFVFLQGVTCVADSVRVVFLPDVAHGVTGLALDEGHLHDFAQAARAGVGEGHRVGHSCEGLHAYINCVLSIQYDAVQCNVSQNHINPLSWYLSSVLQRMIPFSMLSTSILNCSSSTSSKIFFSLDT